MPTCSGSFEQDGRSGAGARSSLEPSTQSSALSAAAAAGASELSGGAQLRFPLQRRSRWVRAALAAASAVATLLAVALGDPVVLAASSTLYVDGSSSSCSDTGSGTQTQPYCTIGAAARSATAGMSVVVNSGTYHEDVSVAHSGVQGAPITLAPAAGASVTITGQSNGFTISGQSWVTISGFNVTGTSSFGIQLSNSAHIIVDGNHVSYSGLPVSGQTAGGIYLNGTTNSLIENNTVDHNTDPGISTHNSSTNDEIRHNVAFNNAEQWQRNAQGIDVESASVTVDYNVTYDNGDHGIDNLNVTGGVLTGNTVYHNCTDGINVEGTSGNYTVENNIAVDNAVYQAYNGISCNRRTGNIGIYDSAPATTTLDYNLVYLTTTGDLYVWANTAYSSPAALFAAT